VFVVAGVLCVLCVGFVGVPLAGAEGFGLTGFGGFLGGGFEGPVLGGARMVGAGSHPSALTTTFVFDHTVDQEGMEFPGEEPLPTEVSLPGLAKSVFVNLPRGMAVDPAAAEVRCTEAQLEDDTCPTASAVGVVTAYVSAFPYRVIGALYDMVAPEGSPGQFGANLVGLGFVVHVDGRVRAGDYGLSGEVNEIIRSPAPYAIATTFWGDPSAAGHDSERGACSEVPRGGKEGGTDASCPVEPTETALLTAPSSCAGGPLVESAVVRSWSLKEGEPEVSAAGVAGLPAMSECGALQFEPSIEMRPERTAPSKATGALVDVHVPQEESVGGTGSADLRDATVTLPAGMSINPSAVAGRTACSEEQIGLLKASANPERQLIALESSLVDTFTLDYGGNSTAPLPVGASAEAVRQALEALPGVGAGAIKEVSAVTGGYEVTFAPTFAGNEAAQLAGTSADDEFDVVNVQGTGGTFLLEHEGVRTEAKASGDILGDATGSGELTKESKEVTGVKTTTGAFEVGREITGVGIPAHTKIVSLEPGEEKLEMSAAAEAAGTGVALMTSSDELTSLSTTTDFIAGEAIAGAGIRAGTTIVSVGSGVIALSAATTADESGAAFSTSLPYYAHTDLVQQALELLPGLAGNVTVTGGGQNNVYTGKRAPYTVAFTGALAGQEPSAQITGKSSLTGSAAVMTVTPKAPTAEPLATSVEGGGKEFAEKVENSNTGKLEATVCPDASKIGTVEAITPLLTHPLPGYVYLAEQEHNPLGSVFGIYLVIDDPASGVIVKLAGKVEAGGEKEAKPGLALGQLRTTFRENPQLPVEDVTVKLFGGEHAPLTTPPTCGIATTEAELRPWSAPEGDGLPSVSSEFDFGKGEQCSPAGFSPTFAAGDTTSPQAGGNSAFVMDLTRADGERYVHSVSVTLPAGLLATLKGVPRCAESEANAGTCSEESKIGEASAAVGVGEPYWVTGGRIYLTGPYHGDPFGLSIVVPAVAGPFNLGTKIVRGGIEINPVTAQATFTTNHGGEELSIPSIIEGVPAYIREIRANVNRQGFVVNPTNCGRLETTGRIGSIASLGSTSETTTSVSSSFQAANCTTLPYKPTLAFSIKGQASKADGESLNATFTARGGPGTPGEEENTRVIKITLPKQLPSRLTTIQRACLAAVFEANPASCPPESDIGTWTVTTPLLAAQFTGPSYLVSHGGAEFPDLETVLQGEGIKVVVDGKIHIKNGITTVTMETLPDVPITSAQASFPTGPFSALGTDIPESKRYDMCGQNLIVPTAMTAQDNAYVEGQIKVTITGCKAPPKPSKLQLALKACRKHKNKHQRTRCEQQARKKYGAHKPAQKHK
jgi:hypothetical protein